jgi:hypothetical protein
MKDVVPSREGRVGYFPMLEDPVTFNPLLTEVVERFEVEAA